MKDQIQEIHIYHHYPWIPNYYPYMWHSIIPPYTQTSYADWVYRPHTVTWGHSLPSMPTANGGTYQVYITDNTESVDRYDSI
jgi:hypothetical protein